MNLMDAALEIAKRRGDVNDVQMLLSFRGHGRVTADSMKVGGSWISFSEPIPVDLIMAPPTGDQTQQSQETTESEVSGTQLIQAVSLQPILKKKPGILKVPASKDPLKGGARPVNTKKLQWADQVDEPAPPQKTPCLSAVDRSPPRIIDSPSNRKGRVTSPTPSVEELINLEDGSSSIMPKSAGSGRSMPRMVQPRRVTKTPRQATTATGVKKVVATRGVKRPTTT